VCFAGLCFTDCRLRRYNPDRSKLHVGCCLAAKRVLDLQTAKTPPRHEVAHAKRSADRALVFRLYNEIKPGREMAQLHLIPRRASTQHELEQQLELTDEIFTNWIEKPVKTTDVFFHKCGHACLLPGERHRHNFNPYQFVCYACTNVPEAETCPPCKVRGQWLDSPKDTSHANTESRLWSYLFSIFARTFP
jgi:hypothetical protein